MWILLISLMFLAGVAAIAGLVRGCKLQREPLREESTPPTNVITPDATCCGQHEVCEKESLLAAISKGIVYYDDEELDQYIGISPEAYTPEQEEVFRAVLYTMLESDVAGWVRSLQLRGIALPDSLKEEVFLIIGERRLTPLHN